MKKPLYKKNIFRAIISIGLWCVAVIYLLALAKIVIFKNGFTPDPDFRTLSLIPFQFVMDFFAAETSVDVLLKNSLGNFAIFIPMGILIPTFFKDINAKKTILICFFVSLSIEVTQYIFSLGITDIDDLILNTLGGIVGTLFYFNLLKRLDSKLKLRVATLAFLCIFGICGVLSIWLYHPSIISAHVKTKIVNLEVLNGLDPKNPDIEAVCTDIKGDSLLAYTLVHDKNSNTESKKEQEFFIDKDTQFFTHTIGAKYSPNGNVQQVIVTYDKFTKEDLEKLLAEKGKNRVCLWVSNDNKCNIVLVWIWAN